MIIFIFYDIRVGYVSEHNTYSIGFLHLRNEYSHYKSISNTIKLSIARRDMLNWKNYWDNRFKSIHVYVLWEKNEN